MPAHKRSLFQEIYRVDSDALRTTSAVSTSTTTPRNNPISMDHTLIVHAGDLDRYAPTRESEVVIPELVYSLVKQSLRKLTLCRIPYGDAVNQPGWDGSVDVEDGFLDFVPTGKSYWEIGTGANPQAKATADFRKRTAQLTDTERAESSFIFVTPRSSRSGGWKATAQAKWIEERRQSGWRLIRVIDGVKLADWTREFPAIGRWLARKVGLTSSLDALSTPAEHWELIAGQSGGTDPPLPPKLFIVGREAACTAVQALFEGRSARLLLFTEGRQDAFDFVAGYLASLAPEIQRAFCNRCLLVREPDAWRAVAETRSPHVLVADPGLGLDSDRADLQTVAMRKGHAVLVPMCDAWTGHSREIVRLRSPSRSQIEVVLGEANFSRSRSKELAAAGGGRLAALRRHLLGLGAVPPYATWENAHLLAQAGLAGKWHGLIAADLAALESIVGKPHGEWIEMLRADALRSDTPLIQRDEKWSIVPRGEAWGSLGPRLTDQDLDRFRETAVLVLGERDPKFDLPKEERFAASLHKKQLAHSGRIREGFAESLALLGSRSDALSSCTHGKAESVAALAVRALLKGAAWDRWASLDSHLPFLAEAAPSEFLDAVEDSLKDLSSTPFRQVFSEEGSEGLTGWNYVSGLLWALETLAWHPDFLARVIAILGDLAAIDPGGTWSNRPSNTLVDILLPWHAQTCAPMETRKVAVGVLLKDRPPVAWKLLLSLLPHNHGFTSGCRRPTWRNYIPPDWTESVTVVEYWRQVEVYAEMAAHFAKGSASHLGELIDRLPDLTPTIRTRILAHIRSEAVARLPEEERLPIWEALVDLVRKHRKFSDTDWAMPATELAEIEEAAHDLAPAAPENLYRELFGDRDFDMYEEKGNYKAQRDRLDQARDKAIQAIVDCGGTAKLLAFAGRVSEPFQVGCALGRTASACTESEVLPSLLAADEDAPKRVVAGFIWARFWKLQFPWVDEILRRGWSAEIKGAFMVLLPFIEEVWERVEAHLGDLGEALYWRNAPVNPYGNVGNLTVAIKKLLQHGRPAEAVLCVSRTIDNEELFRPDLAIAALQGVLASEGAAKRLDQHAAIEVISKLQTSSAVEPQVLFQIEWNFLPWLGRFSSGSPRTLARQLATDPSFFCEVIRLVFRSDKEDMQDQEPTEHRRQVAHNAYRLLMEWGRCPGTQDSGDFDPEDFSRWLNEARRMAGETGHLEIALSQIGHVLTHAPPDPNGLWIHRRVAEALDARDADAMRSGFTTELFNQRGVHGFTSGREERELAAQNRAQAESLEAAGFTRSAAAMREFARRYERDAEREESRDPFED